MPLLEVMLLALALSMDAFAVSIGLGAAPTSDRRRLTLMAAVYFGGFQGLMPLLGYLGGVGVFGWVEAYAPWVAFVLLLLIGGKMIRESFEEGDADTPGPVRVTHRVMLMLAVATSIDALAAGFALTLMPFNPWLACLLIALTTAAFSWAGIVVGTRSGNRLGSRAELLGGVVLILIGLKLLLW